MNYYVSKTGNDDNTGLSMAPVATINKGISKLKPGDTLLIGAGTYIEAVEIKGLNEEGKESSPITTIKALGDGEVRIENTLKLFRSNKGGLQGWVQATDTGAHRDEYVSPVLDVPKAGKRSEGGGYQNGMKGAFLDFDSTPYTRLLNYSDINDLRSNNEKFGKITDPPPGTPGIVQVVNNEGTVVTEEGLPLYYPFVYRGPGFWLERGIDGNPDTARIHIRLSRTHNHIEGLADYKGETNPNKVKLAFTVKKEQPSLLISNSRYIVLKNLTISFGGEHTIKIDNTTGITFGWIKLHCSESGMMGSKNKDMVINNCHFDGGLPTWFFRDDKKSDYRYKSGDVIKHNNVAAETLSSLIRGASADVGTEIYNCNFTNGHDLYLAGEVAFHHNYIHNLNDDGIFFLEGAGNTAKVYRNVFTKCLSCFSFAQQGDPVGGPWYIHRNLIDLREPTEGHRPFHKLAAPQDPERYGWFYKNNGDVGRQYFFHNTVVAINGKKSSSPTFSHLDENSTGKYQRKSFNNIFVAVSINPDIKRAVMKFSSPAFPDETDGNLYYRIGLLEHSMFEYPEYSINIDGEEVTRPGKLFEYFDKDYKCSPFYKDSKIHYGPGYENSGRQTSPGFRSISPDGLPKLTDDFRLRADSPARKSGVVLIEDLVGVADDSPLAVAGPDMGCFRFNDPPLKVGVGSKHSFPRM